jgi:hypothetical protein
LNLSIRGVHLAHFADVLAGNVELFLRRTASIPRRTVSISGICEGIQPAAGSAGILMACNFFKGS